MTYEQAMAYLNGFSRSGAPVTDLHRIAGLLHALGDPQNDLRFIHIAGTNGKGSCAEYLTNILTDSGCRTGTFTSPYIRHYRDRIRLNGEDIPEAAVAALCETVQAAAGDAPYSQFEITMAIAILYFRQEQADIVVLEAGIGGSLDATNVILPPEVCVITSISRDHMQLLGNTVEEIAAQKAGIIKAHCAVAVSPDNGKAVIQVLRQRAEDVGASLHLPNMDLCVVTECSMTGNRFLYQSGSYQTRMGGRKQISNALTVLRTVALLREKGFTIPESAVQSGLQRTQLAARMQVLSTEPLVILDGCHNADGVGALVDALSESGVENWIGICGMTSGKDVGAAAFQLALVLNRVLCVDGFTERAVPAEQMQAAFEQQHAMAVTYDIAKALPYAVQWAKGSHGAVVICGSLYLAGWYLRQEGYTWNLS